MQFFKELFAFAELRTKAKMKFCHSAEWKRVKKRHKKLQNCEKKSIKIAD